MTRRSFLRDVGATVGAVGLTTQLETGTSNANRSAPEAKSTEQDASGPSLSELLATNPYIPDQNSETGKNNETGIPYFSPGEDVQRKNPKNIAKEAYLVL